MNQEEETKLTLAFDEIFIYVPDAIELHQKIRILIGMYDKAEQRAATAEASNGELRKRLAEERTENVILKRRVTTAEASIASVDATLGNRSAFDNCQTREQKIMLAIKIAESNDPKGDLAAAEAARHRMERERNGAIAAAKTAVACMTDAQQVAREAEAVLSGGKK